MSQTDARISIVIPTRNSRPGIDRLLASLVGEAQIQEVIVADSGSTDGLSELALPLGAKLVACDGNRSLARNEGARFASSSRLLFLDSDMEVSRGVVSAVATELQRSDVVCIREQSIARGFWGRCRTFERDMYSERGLFQFARGFRRHSFNRLGGYSTTLVGLEDVDLHVRAVRSGLQVGCVTTPLIHHEEEVGLIQYLKKRSEYGAADWQFRELNPEYWAEMHSIRPRASALLRGLRGYPVPKSLKLLLGVVALRGLELSARKLSL